MAGALEEKVVDLKGRKRGDGGKTKEKDIMKRRQEGGEEEKKMGTEEKGRKKKGKRGAGHKGCATTSPQDAFPSQELGNNITPIKGKLGKNTTPTWRNSEKQS